MARSAQQEASGGSEVGGNPAAPARAASVPENLLIQRIFGFDGLNYSAGGAHIPDQESLWCENLHPIARGKLQAMFDIGPGTYSAPGGKQILGQPHSYVLGSTLYIALLLDDGSVQQVLATNPYTHTQILAPGTSSTQIDFASWGAKYLIILSDVTNGYWIWNGTSLFGAGSIGPEVDIVAGGAGYTTMPTVAALGGTGTGATFTGTIEDGAIATITVTNPGSGWVSTDPTTIALLFDNGASIRSAYGHATLADGVITSVVIDDGGKDYTAVPTITVTDGGGGTGSGAEIIADGFSNGEITSLKINKGGSGYGILGTVTLAFSGGGGTGATAHAVLSNGVITAVTMDDHGNGYIGTPDVIFISSKGTGASGTAILKAKTVDSVTIDMGGDGYISPTYVVFNTPNGPAYATVNIMPFGINGVSVAAYQSRVWISHLPAPPLPCSLLFSDVQNPSSFGPPGGAVPMTQEYLRYKLAHLIPSGSFLYLIGDSSTGYVTGVQTSGSPAVTDFSIVNIDPEIGSPWRDSVYAFGQSVIMVNTIGVYMITGGSVTKISTQIDELFRSDITNIGSNIPSTGAGLLNGVHVFGVLWPIVDPTLSARRRVVLLSDGRRWWINTPNIVPQSIFTTEIDSVITSWVHDGSTLYRMWEVASGTTVKKLRTKMFLEPSLISVKRGLAAYALVQPRSNAVITVKPVTDTAGLGSAITPGFPTFLATSGYRWARSQSHGEGYLLGWQIESTSPDFTINELVFVNQEYTNRFP